MMQPKTVLFYKIPMYNYYWTMTNAQLELIISDKPVSYIKPEKKKFGKPSADRINRSIENYKKRNNK